MTPRERIYALAARLEKDAEVAHTIGFATLEKANDSLFYAKALRDVLPTLSDKQCADIVASWGDERKSN